MRAAPRFGWGARGAWLLAAALAVLGPPTLAAGDGGRRLAARAAAVRPVDAVPSGPGVAERLERIRTRIEAALVYPPLARRDALEGETRLRFDIARDGTPRDVVLHRSSGRPSLDRAALRALDAAAPLPWVYGRLEVPVRFAVESGR